MRYILLKSAAEKSVTELDEFVNGDKYEGVDVTLFIRDIRDLLISGLKNEEERLKKLKGD